MLRSKQIDFVENINLSNLYRIVNMVDPVNPYDAATKDYVDTVSIVSWGDIIGMIEDQPDLQYALADKKDYFAENTGFNKNFGTIVGTVSEGNHTHDQIVFAGGSSVTALLTYVSVSHYLDVNNNKIVNVATCTDPYDSANKKYVDDEISLVLTTVNWGDILGTLTNQTDLQSALNNKSDITHNHSNDLATTVGNIPTWNSVNGTILADGYTVDSTIISGSATALVTSVLIIDTIPTTIGTGGSFSTLKEALDAGYINLILISDVTEVVINTDYDCQNLKLKSTHGNRFVITFGSGSRLTVFRGDQYYDFRNIKIISNLATQHDYFIPSGNKSHIFKNVEFESLSGSIIQSTSGTLFTDIEDLTFRLANSATYLSYSNATINNITIIGGGSSCSMSLYGFTNCIINNLKIAGEFIGFGWPSSANFITLYNSTVNNVIDTSSNGGIMIRYGSTIKNGNLKNLRLYNGHNSDGTYLENLIISGWISGIYNFSNMHFKNCHIDSSVTGFFNRFTASKNVMFESCKITPNIIDSTNIKFSNCYFDAVAPTISVDNNSIDTCTFENDLIVSGDNNTITSSNIGSVNAGIKTITVSVGADKCIITGCRTEATIVSQIDTELQNNVLF